MLVSCRYCSAFHNRGEQCLKRPKNNRTKEGTYITRFRSGRLWKAKRGEIKTLDKYLCQICLKNGKYIFSGLEVHHIEPLVKSWNKRLENSNLVTLCKNCHRMAERGEINKRTLLEITKNRTCL